MGQRHGVWKPSDRRFPDGLKAVITGSEIRATSAVEMLRRLGNRLILDPGSLPERSRGTVTS